MLQGKLGIGIEPGQLRRYGKDPTSLGELIEFLDEVNASQLNHAGYGSLNAKQKTRALKAAIDEDFGYTFQQVVENRANPRTGQPENYWWKVNVPRGMQYELYSYDAWRVLFDALFGGSAASEPTTPTDALGAVVRYRETDYDQATPLIERLVADWRLNPKTVRAALSRMIAAGQTSRDLRRSGPARTPDPELNRLRDTLHESFGIGANGCTFFFTKHGEALTIAAVGAHTRDAKHYRLDYGAEGYPQGGAFEFP
ncbi:MAG: hypothetical protein HS113_15350 [Verrucomicrobiales bacterium]|nr:hypothetical protein [Verrucomicrobiales bacterium]